MRAKQPLSEGTVSNKGVDIHYEVHGEGDHTIVFVPTWSIIHSRLYKAQVPYFSEHFRVMTYDPRGNGKSDRPDTPDGYGLAAEVGDLLAVLDAVDCQKATLISLCSGSLTALLCAAFHPERVEAVVSIGTFTTLEAPHEYRTPVFEEQFDQHEAWRKFNRQYWQIDYQDFCDFFLRQVHSEPHSTKQVEDSLRWASTGDGDMLIMTMDGTDNGDYEISEAMYRRINCPCLFIHGAEDQCTPTRFSERVAKLTGGELQIWPAAGHALFGRYPAKFNVEVRDFLARYLGTFRPTKTNGESSARRQKKALYLSSPIGLGHARRDLAIARALRQEHPDLQIDWLAQDPVTRFLQANEERIHPGSARLANESTHIESEAGEHDLHAFQAIRNMDEILIANFMTFQEVLEEEDHDLVIADEAWDVDHYWHEHPELKKAQIAWLTDFVGWVPMASGGEHEAFLTTDYNAEMIKHVEGHPQVRDRAIFVGNPDDIVPLGFGHGLPDMRDWIPQHYDFCGYVLGDHPATFGDREALRQRLGYRADERVCLVTVGGSGVGGSLIRRILEAYPLAKRDLPDLRMVVVLGPRLDPAQFQAPKGVELRGFVPDLDRHLAACDLALVQGGLTTTMELVAAGTPFLYFPLRNHFEQNVHVAHRLDQYGAGRKMIFDESDPDSIAAAMVEEIAAKRIYRPVEADGAARAAAMLSDLL